MGTRMISNPDPLGQHLGLQAEGLARSAVDSGGDFGQILLGVDPEVRALGKILGTSALDRTPDGSL